MTLAIHQLDEVQRAIASEAPPVLGDGDSVRVSLLMLDSADAQGVQQFVDAVAAAQPRHELDRVHQAYRRRLSRGYLGDAAAAEAEPDPLSESEQKFSEALQRELDRAERKFGEKARAEIVGRIVGLATATARASWLSAVQEVVEAAGSGKAAAAVATDAEAQRLRDLADAARAAASHRRVNAWRAA